MGEPLSGPSRFLATEMLVAADGVEAVEPGATAKEEPSPHRLQQEGSWRFQNFRQLRRVRKP
jgi:hypothetical protein